MTVHAGRDLVRLLLPESALDDLNVDLLDAGVALGAGLRHPLSGDAGTGIGMGEDVVGSVTGGTDRGDTQARTEKPVSMDRHGVVLEDPVLGNVPGPGHRRPLSMTLPA
jgi:hypothetical protein